MAEIKQVEVPDIGGATDVEVIEILVSPGDTIGENDSLITLESDKASMDIPSPCGGIVKDIQVSLGGKVSEGSAILTLEIAGESAPIETTPSAETSQPKQSEEAVAQVTEIRVPDIGGAENVDVIEVSIKAGDTISKDDPIITLESDKASMDVPTPLAGVVKSMNIAVGDKVSEGSIICHLETTAAITSTQAPAPVKTMQTGPAASAESSGGTASLLVREDTEEATKSSDGVYAGPAVRRIAREFGIELGQIKGTGRKGRILKEDVQTFVKARMKGAPAAGGIGIEADPVVDFSEFGEFDTKPLSRIKKLSGANLHRNWVSIPHVTQFDEADITELEAFRKGQKAAAEKQGFKLTPLVFIMKAVVGAMRKYPIFNSSLDGTGEQLIMKKYCHIGIAVDTPDGLMVPVVRDVDKKGLFELAQELGEISERARNKKLTAKDMQGSCFTISSLGGIGGTAFTPIINAPDVAILGVSRSYMKPVFIDGEFVPRLTLPLSLSYDHRVIDGADGARFSQQLVAVLSDIRKILL